MLLLQNNAINTFTITANRPSCTGATASWYMNLIAPNSIDTTTGITLTDLSHFPDNYHYFTLTLTASTILSAACIHVQSEGLADYVIYGTSVSGITEEHNRGIIKISGNSYSDYLIDTINDTQKYYIAD